MRTPHLAVVLALAALGELGCQTTRTEFSDTLHEDATIVETVFTPAKHDIGLGMKAFEGPWGESRDLSGNPGVDIGSGLMISSSTVPEEYAVVFRCRHGKFIIRRKEIYERFHGLDGQTVDVTFREVYRTTYDDQDGQKKVVSRVLTKYDFLNAVLR